jgi:flagellar hook-associated protein 2
LRQETYMTISSIGIGSGLDVNSIVSQLVAIEKQPLASLQVKATNFQSQLSWYGTLQSQASALGDAAAALATSSGWSTQQATSSNAAAVGVSAGAAATAASFTMDVTQLARSQTSATRTVATGSTLGVAGEAGSLTVSLGTWTPGTVTPPVVESFAAGSATPVTISGINGDDSLSTIAGKINAANAGVTATVLSSSGQQRLVFRSSTTGAAAGFSISSAVTAGTFSGLASLSLTTLGNGTGSSAGMESGQTGLNATAKLNGVTIDSATNTLTDVVPGVTLQLNQLTTAPVNLTISQDQTVLQKNIQAFADAYTALNQSLAASTKYVSGGSSGVLQGDAVTTGIQSVLRSIVGSTSVGSSYTRLSQVGLEVQADGSLKLNATKLTTALADPVSLQNLFTANNNSTTTNGFGLKFRDFARGLVAFDGRITNKTTAIQGSIKRNTADQDAVTARAARVETQLRAQYSALDAKMATMTALSSYVTSQIAQWNKSTS